MAETAPAEKKTAEKKRRRGQGEGNARKLASGRWQARYRYPDGVTRYGEYTFDTQADARAWMASERTKISNGTWQREQQAASMAKSFEDYAEQWLKRRKVKGRPLADRTLEGYRDLLQRYLLEPFGTTPLHKIEREDVERWYDKHQKDGTPVYLSKAYSLLRSILNSAVDDGYLPVNPARIRGAGGKVTTHRARILEEHELDVIVEAMPERYRALVLMAYWTGLRYGELTELRRKDLDMKRGELEVSRAVVLADGKFIAKAPKSDAGIRTVTLPEDLMPTLRQHLLSHAAPGENGLLFPSKNDPTIHLRQSALTKVFYPARAKAGRPDFRWHDFRHTHLTNYAIAGATLGDLMKHGGHSTVTAAMTYQGAAESRRADLMATMSKQSKARRAAAAKAAQAD